MNILITGALGYIGSHTVAELDVNKCILLDNLSNSKTDVLEKLKKISKSSIDFFNVDVTNIMELEKIFKIYSIDVIVHFAGYKAVKESIDKPLSYYKNNLIGTMNLIDLALKFKVKKFIFSSSATVYGNQTSPLKEDMKLGKTSNPYGETKAMSERILIDVANKNKDLKITILRYFNPVGAHKSGLIGENPKGIPNNLMPYILKVANKEIEKLKIFGNDYDTKDGTAIRDYIHVMDLAKGHVEAIYKNKNNINIYNLGTGKGTSVLELVKIFQKINKVEVPYEFVERRKGDLAVVFSDVSKAKKELSWEANLTNEDMVKDAWNYIEKNK